MYHLPEEILRKIYEYDSYKEDHWQPIVSDIKMKFLHSIEDEIFTIMTTSCSNCHRAVPRSASRRLSKFGTAVYSVYVRGIRNWYQIKPKLEIRFGQNLDEFDEKINELILKTWKKDW